MNPYAAKADTQQTTWGTIWKTIIVIALAAACLAAILFFYCKSRVDRTHYQDALNNAHQAEDVKQLDLFLLPKFEKTDEGNGRASYTAKPIASGLCSCAPTMVDVVEATFDGNGQITRLSVSQSVGLPRSEPPK